MIPGCLPRSVFEPQQISTHTSHATHHLECSCRDRLGGDRLRRFGNFASIDLKSEPRSMITSSIPEPSSASYHSAIILCGLSPHHSLLLLFGFGPYLSSFTFRLESRHFSVRSSSIWIDHHHSSVHPSPLRCDTRPRSSTVAFHSAYSIRASCALRGGKTAGPPRYIAFGCGRC